MSIIYDALRKAEKNSQGFPLEKKEGIYLKKEKKSKKTGFFLLIAGFFLLAFFAGYNFFFSEENFSFFQQKEVTKTNQEPVSTEEANLKREMDAELALGLPQKKEPGKEKNKYRLEGIIFTGQNPFAVINGKRVKVEDTIDDFVVTGISRGSVELSHSQTAEKTILTIDF